MFFEKSMILLGKLVNLASGWNGLCCALRTKQGSKGFATPGYLLAQRGARWPDVPGSTRRAWTEQDEARWWSSIRAPGQIQQWQIMCRSLLAKFESLFRQENSLACIDAVLWMWMTDRLIILFHCVRIPRNICFWIIFRVERIDV